MENKPKEGQTNIMDLPDVILIHILSLLAFVEGTRLTTISKKWSELWGCIPSWDVDFNLFPEVENKNVKFSSFLEKIIIAHQGTGIQTMKLNYQDYDSADLRAQVWIRHLVDNNIVNLEWNLYDPVHPPLSLFRCRTLVELRLTISFRDLYLPTDISLPSLKVLFLQELTFTSCNLFGRLMKGTPALENMHLLGCSFFGPDFMRVYISHPNVKILNLEHCVGFQEMEVNIRMPNLSEFRFKGTGLVNNQVEIDIPLVSTVVLKAKNYLGTYQYNRREGMTYHYGLNMLSILESAFITRTLSLNAWCIEYLSVSLDIFYIESLDNLECLDLEIWPNEGHTYIAADLINSSPKLRSLTISFKDSYLDNSSGVFDQDRDDYPKPFDILEVEKMHCDLKTVKIKKFKCSDAHWRMVQYLLNNAVALERFSIETATDASRHKCRSIIRRICSHKAYPFDIEID